MAGESTNPGTSAGAGDGGAASAALPSSPGGATDAGQTASPTPSTTGAADTSNANPETSSQETVNPHAAFFDEIDGLGAPASASTDGGAATGTEQKDTQGKETSSSVANTGGADDKTAQNVAAGAGKSQTSEGKPENPNVAQGETEGTDDDESDDFEGEAQEQPDPLTNWRKADPDDEAYIQKHLPKVEWGRARKAFKDAKALRTFQNPNIPASVFVENLKNKSGMRFGEVEREIFKRNAETDPVGLLTKVYEATQDKEGNSAAYQRLMDEVIGTNPEYAETVLKKRGYLKDQPSAIANNSQNTEAAVLTDADIDAFEQGDAFKQLQDVLPEEAKRLKGILDGAKQAKAAMAEAQAAKEKAASEADKNKQTEKEKQAQEAAQTAYKASVDAFNEVYDGEVKSAYTSKLDKDYGLAVTAEEKEKSPMMAFLKNAKRALILAGGIENPGDFDNDLFEWGKTRPAYKQAADALVKFTKAGEKENARAAARELKPFIDLFLQERLKTPEIALIDEIIQMVAREQKAKLETKIDTAPETTVARSAGAGGGNFLDEIDSLPWKGN